MIPTKRATLRALLGLGLILVVIAALVVGPYALRVRHFEADPGAGYHADFYLYVSPGARRIASETDRATILIQPNNSGTNSDDPELHRRDAWWTGFGRHGLADELELVLLVPAFLRPAEDWHIYTHALDRDVLTTERQDLARLDLQLLAMVDNARAALDAEGLSVGERFLLQGYSASGMFANRFTALQPERVLAVAAGSPGGWPILPLSQVEGESLPYPAGVADLEQLTGRDFDAEAYARVPQLIVMGSLDDNDSLDFTDGWDEAASAATIRCIVLTGLRNPCAQLDGIQRGRMEATLERHADGTLLRKAGIMGVVLTGGEVRPGDPIAIELPPAPQHALEPV